MLSRLALSLAFATPASAAISRLDLADYRLVETIPLVLPGNSEASGVTYSPESGHLYVVEDEGQTLYELSTTGTVMGTMTMEGFEDVEGITYVGGGRFLVVEERLQDVYRFTFSAGGNLRRAVQPFFSFGATVGNIGLEGVSFDPVGNLVFGVKETGEQALYTANLNVSTMTGTSSSFVPSLGVLDLADIQALGTVPSLLGTPDQNNLLVISQESAKLLEISRSGEVLSQLDFTGVSESAEGVTIGEDGTIYVVTENPYLLVFRPVPEVSAALIGSLGLLTLLRRRRLKG